MKTSLPSCQPMPRRPFARALIAIAAFCAVGFCSSIVQARTPAPPRQSSAGDAPAVALPLATDVSARLTHRAVRHAIRKVADWQLSRAETDFDQDWTYAALYAGFMAVPDAAGGKKFREAMVRMGKKFQWQPGPRLAHADDQAIGQTYLELYQRFHDPAMLAPIRARMDAVMQLPDSQFPDKDKPLWWWCDALFMAPPVLAKLSAITGDRKYLNFMDRQWSITSNLLYDPRVHLFYRDATFLGKHEANGRGLFWSRGNGWVMAGLARVLTEMPPDYPTRAKYVTQFQQMAAEIASLQGSDGLWRPGLLDASAYPLPENSGSAFDVYALAYGVNHGILGRATYLPVIEKGWAGLISHIYEDGRLGCIQPIGAAPGDYPATASYVFGTGAFLLAGSEVDRLAR
ncbi:MAG TPA: glycoside hydrolase family 88 protein [Terracidiphilus sp.]|jgi:rhamnogalacturonyl hydrolase YesR